MSWHADREHAGAGIQLLADGQAILDWTAALRTELGEKHGRPPAEVESIQRANKVLRTAWNTYHPYRRPRHKNPAISVTYSCVPNTLAARLGMD